jgi:hypothetical protein
MTYQMTHKEQPMPFEAFIILVIAAMCFVAAYRAD